MPSLRPAHIREGREAQGLSGAERPLAMKPFPFHSFGRNKLYLAWKNILMWLCAPFPFTVVEGNKISQLAVYKAGIHRDTPNWIIAKHP